MQRTLLFLIAGACAWVLVAPLLAQEEEKKAEEKGARDSQVAQETVAGALSAFENTLKDLGEKSDVEAVQTMASAAGGVLQTEVFGFSLGHLLASFFILLTTMVFRNLISKAVIRRLLALAERSKSLNKNFVLALTKPFSLLLLIVGCYLALIVLPLNPFLSGLIGNLFRGATMLTLVWGALLLTDVFADLLESRMCANPNSAIYGFAPLVKKTLKIFVLVVGLLMTIDNLGYNVTGVLATLGLGTAAVALASQDTIKNAFGAMMIALDRPFRVGDWIQVGDKVDGDVESIGLRSTKVRTWPKTILSIPNGVLANEYINNWSRMPKRRVKQIVGISYEASAQDMEAIVQDIRTLLHNDEGVEPQFILVNFTDFGESSLDILVYYFTKSTAWLEHMDVRQRINCKIMRAVHARGLSIAFPTRSVHLEGPAASKMAGTPYASRWANDALPGDQGPTAPP